MAFKNSKGAKNSGGGAGDKLALFKKRRDSLGFPWSSVSGGLLVAALDAATKNGAAVMFGGTQGGRGVSVTVFRDGDKDREFCSFAEEFDDLMHEVISVLGSKSEDLYAIHNLPSPDGEGGAE